LMGLATEGFQRFGHSQAEAWRRTEGDAAEKFLATGGNYVRFARRHPALFRLMFSRFAVEHHTDALDQASKAAFQALQRDVAVAVGLPPGSDAAQLAAYNARVVVHGLSQLILEGQIDGAAKAVDSMVEAALRQWMLARG